MAYNAKEIWVPCDSVTAALGADGAESTGVAILSGSGAVPRGLLFGVHGRLATTNGEVVVRVYSDASETTELYNVMLDFSGGVTQASDMMVSPIPMFETPYYTTEADATSTTKDFTLTFYVKAIA